MMSAALEVATVPMKCAPGAHALYPSLTDPYSICILQKRIGWNPQPNKACRPSPSACFHCSPCCSGDNWQKNLLTGTEFGTWGLGGRVWKWGRGQSWGLITLPKVNEFKETTTKIITIIIVTWMDFLWLWIRTKWSHEYSPVFRSALDLYFSISLWHH